MLSLVLKVAYLCCALVVVWAHSVDPECGISDFVPHTRVINGTVCERGELPWIVLVGGCTGSIISKNYVLTAGHCIETGEATKVIAGVADYKQQNGSVVVSGTATRHPKFFDKCFGAILNDISILKLAEPLNFTKYIRPICLKKTFEESSDTEGLISGYGANKFFQFPCPHSDPDCARNTSDSKLRRGTSQFLDQKHCRREWWFHKECYRNEVPMLCSKGKNEVDVYKGDSGSPLSVKNSSRTDGKTQWMQVGITSFGDVKQYQGRSVVFTRVPSYCDWIAEVTNNEATCVD